MCVCVCLCARQEVPNRLQRWIAGLQISGRDLKTLVEETTGSTKCDVTRSCENTRGEDSDCTETDIWNSKMAAVIMSTKGDHYPCTQGLNKGGGYKAKLSESLADNKETTQ